MHAQLLYLLIVPVLYLLLEMPRVYARRKTVRFVCAILVALFSLFMGVWAAQAILQARTLPSELTQVQFSAPHFWQATKMLKRWHWYWIIAAELLPGAVAYVFRPQRRASPADDPNDRAKGRGAKICAILMSFIIIRYLGTALVHVLF